MDFETEIAETVATRATGRTTERVAGERRAFAWTARACVLVALVFVLSAAAPIVRASSSATIWTDKGDYYFESIVTIYGAAFTPSANVTVSVTDPAGGVTMWTVLSNDTGGFTTTYQLGTVPGTYHVTATDGVNTATTTFEDATIDFTQCENDSGKTGTKHPCAWTTGGLDQQHNVYVEGNAIPQRLFHQIPIAGSHTMRFTHDFTKSSVYAFDFLTSPDLTQSGALLNECADLPTFVTPSQCAALFSGALKPPIPSDSFDGVAAREYPSSRAVRIGGVTSPTVTIVGHDPSTPCFQSCGTSDVIVDISFTTTSANQVVALWFAGHAAIGVDPDGPGPAVGWGVGWGAGSISGSPFHIKYISLDGDSVGNRDNQLSVGAVQLPGEIKIVKNSVGGNGVFTYTATGVTSPFTITTTGGGPGTTGTGSKDFIPLDPGTYTFAESGPSAPWSFTGLACTVALTSAYTITGQSVSIDLVPADVVTCTYTNTNAAGLTVIKHVVNDNGGTLTASAFTLHVKSGGTDVAGSPAAGSETGTSYSLPAGTYVVSEDAAPAGYAFVSFSGDCDSTGAVTLAAGDSKTCTITNDDIAPSLTLVKVVVNDNGGTAVATDFTLTATGPTSISGAGGVVSGPTFSAGTYTLSETALSGYAASAWSCVGGTQSGSSITLSVGQSATCTITNDDITAHLKLVKNVVNDNGGTAVATDWTLSASGPTPLSGAGVAESDVNAGTYTLSETGPSGYAASAWSCVGGTQSGSSITLALGQSATCTITNNDIAPSLTLVKVVVNDNGGTAVATDFTLTASGPTPISGAGGATSGPTFSAGTYTLSETGPSGYAASAWSCVGGTQSGSTITLGVGQSATCTITNDDIAPSLTLVKVVVNDNGGTRITTEWTLSAAGPTPISGAGGVVSGPTFSAGTYTLSEAGPTDYAASAWSCAGGTQSGSSITLGLGQSAVCTITNDDIAPSLTLVKVVVNDNGGTRTAVEWTLSAAGPTPISGAGGATSGPTFSAGTYTLSEAGPTDYAASAWSCAGGTQSGSSITLSVGQSATCTITNDDIAPSLILTKTVDNGGTGGSTAADFTLVATGPSLLSGPGPLVSSGPTFKAGTYGLSESGPSGYDASGWTCTGGTQSGSSITLALAESAACGITNTKRGTIVVQKFSYGGTGTFHYTLEGSGPLPGQITTTGAPGFGTFTYSDLTPTGILGHGTYTLTESGVPNGWTLASISCTLSSGLPASATVDVANRRVVIDLPVGETVTCTFTNVLKSIVSDSSLCTFDRDANQAGQQFRLLFTPDPTNMPYYKVTATNPGQFYYNIFLTGTGSITLDVYIPYPFVTQGAVPIHAYDSATIVRTGDQGCIIPGTEFFNMKQYITLNDYALLNPPGTFGSQVHLQIPITFPASGFAYVNLHLDYGLKGTTGWTKNSITNAAENVLPPFEIADLGTYVFSYNLGGVDGDTQTIQNENVFKKDPGFGGRVLYDIDNAAQGYTVSVTRVDTGAYIGSGSTDVDGFFMVPYKHTGKAAYFTLCVVGHPEAGCQTVLLKANSFAYLETPFFVTRPSS